MLLQSALCLGLLALSPIALAAQAGTEDCSGVTATDSNDVDLAASRNAGKSAKTQRKSQNAPASRSDGSNAANSRAPRWQSFLPGMFR